MVLVCAALLVSVTMGHSAVRAVERIRVLVPRTTAALPFLKIAGDHALPGADIEARLFANHAQALALLLRADTDLLLSGTSQGWENRLDGSPIVMVDTGVWALASLVGRDPGIRTFADLRGKRLALPFPGSPLDFQTRALLARAGVNPETEVSISYGPFAQSVSRLLAGRLDAAALPEPVATEVVEKNGLLRLADYARAWAAVNGGDGRSPQVSLFTTERFASSHRTLLVSLVEAWRESSREIAADPKAAARAYSSNLGLEPDILAEATLRSSLDVPDFAENRSRVLAYYRLVAPYLPGRERGLDAQFFFMP